MNIANKIININCKIYPIACERVYTLHFYNLYDKIKREAVILHTLNTPIQ